MPEKFRVRGDRKDIRSFLARLSGAAEKCGRVGNIPYGDLVMKTIVLNGMSNKLIRDRAIKNISDGDLMNLTLLVDFISKEETCISQDIWCVTYSGLQERELLT